MAKPSNVSHIELSDGRTVLTSYGTPVAVFVPGSGVIAHNHRYSVTTSRHVSQFAGKATITRVDDAAFAAAIAPVAMGRAHL